MGGALSKDRADTAFGRVSVGVALSDPEYLLTSEDCSGGIQLVLTALPVETDSRAEIVLAQ